MIEYSPLDFNKNGDVSQMELAAAHKQAEDSTKKKKPYSPAMITLALGFLVIIFASAGIYGGISGGRYKIIDQDYYWSPDYPMIIISSIVIVITVFFIIRAFVRQHKKAS